MPCVSRYLKLAARFLSLSLSFSLSLSVACSMVRSLARSLAHWRAITPELLGVRLFATSPGHASF